MNNSTALVTGANKGIGKEIARQLAQAGVTVWVGSRDPGNGQRAAEEVGGRALVLDVTDSASIAAAARTVEHLDILVNNAGITAVTTSSAESDVDGFRRTFETNVFGVLAVTNAFLPALRRSEHPRIVNVSSGTGSITLTADRTTRFATGGMSAYRVSKSALNELTVLYSNELAPDGFKVNAYAPGLRATDLNALTVGGGDPAEGAAGAVRLALLPDDGPTGQFVNWDGAILPW